MDRGTADRKLGGQPAFGDALSGGQLAAEDAAQNILVIKTGVGMANAAAVALDHMNWREVVGSIAGDDTIACFSKSPEETLQLLNKIKKIINQ